MSQITVLDGNGTPQTIAAIDDTGQALAADCLPVVLPAAQAAALASETTLAAVVAALGSPLQAGGSIGNTTFAATQSGSWTVGVSGSVAVTGTFWQATQPVSVASLPLPSGASTEATLAAQSAKLPASLGPKAGAASLSVVEATPTTVTIVSLQTNATGATYNAFASQACEALDIVNTAAAAVDLEVRRGASGNTIIVPAGSSRMFVGLSNASDLQVRRLDQSNTQVTFTAEAIKQ